MTREIPLSRGLVALVDDEDFELVSSVGKWYADRSDQTYYARKNYWLDGRSKSVKMHKLLTGWALVDHVNGNGLDNRRENLRQASSRQNAMNRGHRSDNTSGFKGVQRYKPNSPLWAARIWHEGHWHRLGRFEDPAEAARAYDAAARSMFGDFARTNFPKES